jgi:hypothetical protein
VQLCSVKTILIAGSEEVRSDAEAEVGDPELARDTLLSGACACELQCFFPRFHCSKDTFMISHVSSND